MAVTFMVGGSIGVLGQVTKITCESTGDKYRYCSAKTDNEVRMLQQISAARCDQGKSWGYDKNGVWVDHNCAAEFEVGRTGPSTSQKIAAAAAAGTAVLQALLATSQTTGTAGTTSPAPPQAQTAAPPSAAAVPAWLVGTFQALNPKTEAQVYVSIDQQGISRGAPTKRSSSDASGATRSSSVRKNSRIGRQPTASWSFVQAGRPTA
jgi:hypothetical protein